MDDGRARVRGRRLARKEVVRINPTKPRPASNGARRHRAPIPQPIAPQPAPALIVEDLPMERGERSLIGGGILVFGALALTQLLAIWPAVMAATSAATPQPKMPSSPLLFGVAHMTFDRDVVLMLMVLLVGAGAALVGVSWRFLRFARLQQLTKRDEWAYALRPLQGAVLALVVYFTLRGGLLGQDQSAPVNPYGIAALAGLVGLFTRHAVSKLTDVFDTVFGKPGEDTEDVNVVERGDVGAKDAQTIEAEPG
jgi:hypothetical protein